jgi:transposase
MEQLDISDGFDMHNYRRGLKLLSEDRKTTQLANPADEFACPACGKPFERLFVSEKRTNSFGNPGTAFCLARTDEKLLLLTH